MWIKYEDKFEEQKSRTWEKGPSYDKNWNTYNIWYLNIVEIHSEISLLYNKGRKLGNNSNTNSLVHKMTFQLECDNCNCWTFRIKYVGSFDWKQLFIHAFVSTEIICIIFVLFFLGSDRWPNTFKIALFDARQ